MTVTHRKRKFTEAQGNHRPLDTVNLPYSILINGTSSMLHNRARIHHLNRLSYYCRCRFEISLRYMLERYHWNHTRKVCGMSRIRYLCRMFYIRQRERKTQETSQLLCQCKTWEMLNYVAPINLSRNFLTNSTIGICHTFYDYWFTIFSLLNLGYCYEYDIFRIRLSFALLQLTGQPIKKGYYLMRLRHMVLETGTIFRIMLEQNWKSNVEITISRFGSKGTPILCPICTRNLIQS